MASITVLALAACSPETQTEIDRTEAGFIHDIGGTVSALQWWRTAVMLNINVDTPAPVEIWLMSGNDKGTLYDYCEAKASGKINMMAPQGKGNTLYIVTVCNRHKEVKEITLTGMVVENIDLNVSLPPVDDSEFSTRTADNKAENKAKASTTRAAASLYGTSIAGNAKHNELSPEQIAEALELLEHAYKEFTPAKSFGANCDYELKSNGKFNITWFAGNCQSHTPHILGYYYHTPGTYDDIKYVDLAETEIYDYIDGLAKVQYKVNDAAAQEYGVMADHWYDANFDMGDTFEDPHVNINARRGDDAYNSIDVFNRYGSNITNLRGLSFEIDVPEGMYVGFYDRVEDQALPEQYDRFVRLGIKPYTSRDNFKAMNFSCEAMNLNLNGSYRSSVFKTGHALWLGMENDYTGGDLDCNDVMFEVSADLEIHHPSVVEPDLKPFGEYDDRMPWTIAYEDVARNADFDFNDAVIRIVPFPEKEKCAVTAMAVGSTAKMYLHYDGPDGDLVLGEMHELLHGSGDKPINTTSATLQTDFAKLDTVAWPKGYTIANDARRFYIEVKRGTCADCSDVITLPEEPGKMPEALLVAGEWKWPLEGVNINTAYTNFARWSRNVARLDYWNWYDTPRENTCINY